MGGLIRVASSDWVASFMAGSSEGDPLTAEVSTLKIDLNIFWDSDIRSAICEVGCLEIVEALQDNMFHFHELASKVCVIRSLLQREWNIHLVQISKSVNDTTYCLARLGAARQCVSLRLEVPLLINLISFWLEIC